MGRQAKLRGRHHTARAGDEPVRAASPNVLLDHTRRSVV